MCDGLIIADGEAVACGERTIAGGDDGGSKAAADGVIAQGKIGDAQGGGAARVHGDGRGELPRAVHPQGGEQGDGKVAACARPEQKQRQR